MSHFHKLLEELEQLHEKEVSSLKDEVNHLRALLGEENEGMATCELVQQTPERRINEHMPPRLQVKRQDTLSSHHSLHSSGSRQAGTVLERLFPGRGTPPTHEEVEVMSEKSKISLTLDWVNRAGQESASRNKYHERLLALGLPTLLEDCVLWWLSLEEPPRHGCLHRFTSSSWFEGFSMWVIFLNATLIIYVADRNMKNVMKGKETNESKHPLDQLDAVIILEMFLTLVVVAEVSMKLLVHRLYFFVGNQWKSNILDFTVVMISLLFYTFKGANLMHIRLSKLAKSARLLRVLRSFRYFRQLNLLLMCTVGALSSLFWCLVFLCVFILAFSLVFVQAFAAHVEAYPEDRDEVSGRFDGIFTTSLRLFQVVTAGEDWYVVYNDLSMIGASCQGLLILYIAICVLALWNIISAIFIERALAFSSPDIESALTQKKLTDEQDIADLTNLFASTTGADGRTSKQVFLETMQSSEVQEFFSVRNINVTDADLFFTMLHASIPAEYSSENSSHGDANLCIDTSIIVNACMHMKGVASNFDLLALHWDIRRMFTEIHESLARSENSPNAVAAVAVRSSPRASNRKDHDGPQSRDSPVALMLSSLDSSKATEKIALHL